MFLFNRYQTAGVLEQSGGQKQQHGGKKLYNPVSHKL
jgi:hypothetical protein